MKNFAKIFMAVAALCIGFACATDVTEDLGVNVGGQSVVTLSLEESRTQLGEEVDGLYPVVWSKGDVVAVNGNASTSIEIVGNGQSAMFTFATALERPWSVVYPATDVKPATEGLQAVTFLATQEYKAGTFCEGAAPMYGYAAVAAEGEEPLAVQLNHLTGVLRLAVKGDATLTSMKVTAEESKIAGNFDIDCQSGALTAHADASNTVTVTFGEGLTLNATEATPIYVAVPAGKHGLFTIEFVTESAGTMVARFNSDYHPVKAGVVKEFGEVSFVANANNEPMGGDLVITNEAELLRLAKLGEVNALTNVTSVTIAATIDMSNVATWHPIANFPAITFDGGSDKGYEIKGLTAPLFEEVTGATIKNVKLTNVDIVEYERLLFGAVVCKATDSTLSNCSVAGAIRYNNTTTQDFTYNLGGSSTDSAPDDLCVAGVVGLVIGGSLNNCTNAADITITEFVVSTSATSDVAVGGVVATLFGTKDKVEAIANCANTGVIAVNASKGKVRPVIGGIVGYVTFANLSNVTNGAEGTTKGSITIKNVLGNCTRTGGIVGSVRGMTVDTAVNYAPIEYKSLIQYPYMGCVIGQVFDQSSFTSVYKNITNYGSLTAPTGKAAVSGTPYLGGIIGRQAGSNLSLEKCYNHGNLNLNFLSTGNSCVGGILAGGATANFTECDNYGAITLDISCAEFYLGGVVGKATTANYSKCNNYGAITSKSKGSATLAVGGVAGNGTTVSVDECSNTGAITLDGTCAALYIGGVSGYSSTTNDFDNNSNNAPIYAKLISSAGASIGGVTGVATGGVSGAVWSNNSNGEKGDITIEGEFSGNAGICGLGANFNYTNENCSNAGDVLVTAKNNTGTIYVGGHSWTGNHNITNFTNSGNLTFAGEIVTASKALYMWGIGYTPSKTWTNVHNTGSVKVDSKAVIAGEVRMGGFARSTAAATLDNCTNSGDIIFEGTTTTASKAVLMGGFAGDSSAATKFKTNCTNSGDVIFAGTAAGETRIGGLFGHANVTLASNGAEIAARNTGKVSNYLVKDGVTTVGKTAKLFMGGVIGKTWVDQKILLQNTGDINVRYAEGCYTDCAYIGGILGSITLDAENGAVSGKVLTGAQCFCNIAAIGVTESATVTPIVGVGMIIGNYRGATALVNSCQLGGKLAVEEENGQPIYLPVNQNPIDDESFQKNGYFYYEKIYGGAYEWKDTNYDGCSYISSLEF